MFSDGFFKFFFILVFSLVLLTFVGVFSFYGYTAFKIHQTCQGDYAKCAGKVVKDFKEGMEGK